MKKIDLHLHVRSSETDDIHMANAKDMTKHLVELGIEKAVLMSNGEKAGRYVNNAQNKMICDEFPEYFAWTCTLDLVDQETIYDRLAGYKAEGAIGIGELTINRRWDDPFLQDVFAAAEKLNMPITFHMSPEEGFSYGVVDEPGLPFLEQTLQKYPNCKFLGHSQCFWIEMSGDAPKDREGRNSRGEGSVVPGGRIPELFSKYPNIYGDLSAYSGACAIMRDPEFGLIFLETYADRLFFATDMTDADMVLPLGAWLDEQVAVGKLSKETYEKICYKNAERIFNL